MELSNFYLRQKGPVVDFENFSNLTPLQPGFWKVAGFSVRQTVWIDPMGHIASWEKTHLEY